MCAQNRAMCSISGRLAGFLTTFIHQLILIILLLLLDSYDATRWLARILTPERSDSTPAAGRSQWSVVGGSQRVADFRKPVRTDDLPR